MKTILQSICLFLILSACTKTDNGNGSYTIKGKLLNNCEDQQPVANQLLYFLVDVDSDEEDRVAYTDAKGNFNYTFDGPPNNNSSIGGSIRIQNDKPILCGIPSSGLTADKEMNTGTLYANAPQKALVTFNIQGSGYSNRDTVIISTISHTDLRKVSTFKIPGPFDSGVSESREWLKYASSGTMTMPAYEYTTQPHVRRLHGTFGTIARWQVIQENGELTETERESVLMDACENEAAISINLPQAP
ncbi:hypothetical protein [Owenweeksia hongkongensis]|uniref:hypothetical protein n=1 Tax=Owenweeksia hongkongensis TaxID=253245 RepID=UPI003A8F2238